MSRAGALRLVFCGLAVLLAAAGGAARAQDVPVLEGERALERKLLQADLADYATARTAEREARAQADQVAGRADELLAGDALSAAALAEVESDLEAARRTADAAGERSERLRRGIGERLRRLALIDEELAALRGAREGDPVSGRWRVHLAPQERSGIFELQLEGTLVSGSYRLEGGGRGSFRGTWSEGVLRLERIDADRGFDSEYEGTIDAAAGRIDGTWQGHDLASGEPASGTWTAERLGPEGELIEEEDIE